MVNPDEYGKEARQAQEGVSQEDQRNSELESRRLGASRRQGEAIRTKPDSTNSPSGSGQEAGPSSASGGTISGGILRQLIEEIDDQLADYQSRIENLSAKIEKLSARRVHLDQLFKDLQVKTGETPAEGEEDLEEMTDPNAEEDE